MEGSLYSPLAFHALDGRPDPQTKRMIERLLNQSMESVKLLLDEHRDFVEDVAQALMAHDELTGDDVQDIATRLGVQAPVEETFQLEPAGAAAARPWLGAPGAAARTALDPQQRGGRAGAAGTDGEDGER